MSELKEVEQAVTRLSNQDLAAFRRWFAEFDAQQWDQELEKDVTAGRLDHLAERALQHLDAGQMLRNQ